MQQVQSSCRLCGRPGIELFLARDFKRPSDRTEYAVTWCRECELGRVATDFSPRMAVKFFDLPYYTHGLPTQAEDFQRSLLERAITHLAWQADEGRDFVPAELGPAEGRSVCDIGCGSGAQLLRLKQSGFTVVGVEPDPLARAVAARKLDEVFDGTLEVLPQEVLARRFDVVLLFHVLDACCDFNAALANVRSILSNEGVLIVEVPNCASKGFRCYGANWPWVDVPRHQTFFTERSLQRALRAHGFSVQKPIYVGYTRQFSPAWKSHHRSPLLWLARTACASDASKYDSLRVYSTLST